MKISTPAAPDVQKRHAQIRQEIALAAGQGPEKAREILRRQLGELSQEWDTSLSGQERPQV
jgi:hypothetical protein